MNDQESRLNAFKDFIESKKEFSDSFCHSWLNFLYSGDLKYNSKHLKDINNEIQENLKNNKASSEIPLLEISDRNEMIKMFMKHATASSCEKMLQSKLCDPVRFRCFLPRIFISTPEEKQQLFEGIKQKAQKAINNRAESFGYNQYRHNKRASAFFPANEDDEGNFFSEKTLAIKVPEFKLIKLLEKLRHEGEVVPKNEKCMELHQKYSKLLSTHLDAILQADINHWSLSSENCHARYDATCNLYEKTQELLNEPNTIDLINKNRLIEKIIKNLVIHTVLLLTTGGLGNYFYIKNCLYESGGKNMFLDYKYTSGSVNKLSLFMEKMKTSITNEKNVWSYREKTKAMKEKKNDNDQDNDHDKTVQKPG